MITTGSQKVVKFTHLISKEGENNKCYIKYVFWKFFQNSIKLLTSPFLVVLQAFLLEERSKENWALKRHTSGHQGHSTVTTNALGQSSTWDTRAREEDLGTWALGHSRHLGIRGALFSRLEFIRQVFPTNLILTFSTSSVREECRNRVAYMC